MDQENGYGSQSENDSEFHYWLRGQERSGYSEMARMTSPQRVRHEARQFLAIQESTAWRLDQQPNKYLVDSIINQLATRSRQVTMSFPMGYGQWSAGDVEAGLPTNPDKATELATEYDRTAEEIEARRTLLQITQEQAIFSGDLKTYVEDAFTRLGKTRMDAANYGRIFRLEQSEAEFDSYGEKVEKALDKWKEVAEGRAVVDLTLPDGSTGTYTLPNPFAMPRNTGYFEWIMTNYVAEDLDSHEHVQRQGVSETVMQKALELDNIAASTTALLILDHWDLDVEWSNSRAGYKQVMTPADIKDIVFELGTKDVEKMTYPESRRVKEYRGQIGTQEGRRDYVRPVGPPSTLGCYPRMTSSAIDILTLDAPLLENGAATTEKASISLKELVWGGGSTRIFDDTTHSFRTVNFQPMKFSEIPWDDVGIFGVDGKFIGTDSIQIKPAARGPLTDAEVAVEPERREIKIWDMVEGVSTNAYEVPYRLQAFLAHKAVFSQITRTDYDRLYPEIISGNLLPSLNKNWENSLNMMAGGKGISKETAQKLNEYTRVVFLGGVGASIAQMTSGLGGTQHGLKHENQPQVDAFQTIDTRSLKQNLKQAAKTARFLLTEETRDGVKVDKRSEKLLDYIIDNRKAPTPYELVQVGLRDWFTQDELESLRSLYPLG